MDIENIKEKLFKLYQEQDKDGSMISNNKTKIIDLNYFMDNSIIAEKHPINLRSNTTSIHNQTSLMRDLKLSSTRKEVIFFFHITHIL